LKQRVTGGNRYFKEELDKLEQLSISAIEMLKVGPASLGAGALAGVAAYGGTLAIGTASTGTAIATLSGAAATKATMAALGGVLWPLVDWGWLWATVLEEL
jgi:6-phosphogluconate dehydrogenase (decarboxylating)